MHWSSWAIIMLGVVTLYEVFSFRRDFERIHKSIDRIEQGLADLEQRANHRR